MKAAFTVRHNNFFIWRRELMFQKKHLQFATKPLVVFGFSSSECEQDEDKVPVLLRDVFAVKFWLYIFAIVFLLWQEMI
jgi:hypothetical protein